jgi:hydrogenase nickel incorporation protein HypA/HybF
MHELSICAALLRQVLALPPPPEAPNVGRITLRIGPLAGVEPAQLQLAFPLVAAGTACAGARIEICAGCGAWQVTLVGGDEMLLARVEFLAPIPPQVPADV